MDRLGSTAMVVIGLGFRMVRGLALLLTIAVLGACVEATAEPTSEPDIARFDDLSLDEAIGWFEERTLRCIGPGQAFPDLREWRCMQEWEDGSKFEARITADQSGVSQLVGIAHGLNAEDSASFLGSTVAVLAVPEQDREALTLWALQHAEAGGQRVFGKATVALQPYSVNRAVVVTALP